MTNARAPAEVVEQIVRDLTDFNDNIGMHYPTFIPLIEADEWDAIRTTITALTRALERRQQMIRRSLNTDFAFDVRSEEENPI
jgi:hypothetical protein